MPHLLTPPPHKRDDAAVVLGDRHRPFLKHHIGDVPPIAGEIVQLRQKIEQAVGCEVDVGDRLCVRLDCKAQSRRPPSIAPSTIKLEPPKLIWIDRMAEGLDMYYGRRGAWRNWDLCLTVAVIHANPAYLGPDGVRGLVRH